MEFLEEHHLSEEALRIDLLIVKKIKDTVIQNEIGRIFRGHNVIEYKSPDDNLSIDDFYKTIGYACIYKGLGETVNIIPAEELTVSLFRESYPQKMAAALLQSGMTIEQRFQGIYYVSGQLPFPVQIVATGELKRDHRSLRILSKNADENDVMDFLEAVVSTPGEKNSVSAVLDVSMAANVELYEKIRRENVMCDMLREMMKDELTQATREAKLEGKVEFLSNMMKSLSLDADKAMDILCIPAAERETYRSHLS